MAPRPLFQHHRQHVAHAQEHPLQIDRDHLIEDRFVIFLRRRGPPFDARVVEEAVDGAVRVERRLHIGLHVGGFGDVRPHEACIAAALTHQFGACLACGRVGIDHHDLGAASRETDRAGAADAAATAGDQGHLACEFHRCVPSQSTSSTALPDTRRSRNCSATPAKSRQLRSAPIRGLSDPSAISDTSSARSGANRSSASE